MTWTDRVATILHLIAACCPMAIAWLIITIVVPTIKCQFRRWSWSHIFVESKKAFAPADTNSDSSSAIVFPANVIRVIASFQHISPNGIFDGVRKAMFSIMVPIRFNFKASAAFCIASFERIEANYTCFPTGALAFAMCRYKLAPACVLQKKSQDSQSVKLVSFFDRCFTGTRSTAFRFSICKSKSENPFLATTVANTLAALRLLIIAQNFPSTEASFRFNIDWLGHWNRMFESARKTLVRLAGNFQYSTK